MAHQIQYEDYAKPPERQQHCVGDGDRLLHSPKHQDTETYRLVSHWQFPFKRINVIRLLYFEIYVAVFNGSLPEHCWRKRKVALAPR